MNLEQFYRNNFDRFVKRMKNRAGTIQAAEDVVQEAFYRALKYQDSFDPTQPLENWFNRILNNSLKEYKNKEKGHIADSFDEDEVDGTDCRMMSQQLWDTVRSEINQYDGEHYEILSLYFEHQYKPRDICNVVDMKYKTVEQILQRFKRMIKEEYGEKL